MIELKKIREMLLPYKAPVELEELVKFQNSSNNYYSLGFEITENDGKGMLNTYSTEDSFQKRFLGFANADGTGSEYMFWLKDTTTELSECPIVVFGSEGGVHAVASNFRELLQLLSLDIEPMVMWDQIIYYKADDEGSSKGHDKYLGWLANFDIKIVASAANILESAQSKHQDQLDEIIKLVT